MDQDILDIKRRAGLLEDDVIDLGARRKAKQRAERIEQASKAADTLNRMRDIEREMIDIIFEEIRQTEYAVWLEEGAEGDFESYFKEQLRTSGRATLQSELKIQFQLLEKTAYRKLRDLMS